jgi:4-hydroxybenzoate polyprenyltransferase
MGFCRGCNLLLGMSVIGWFNQFILIAIIPTVYIFAITMISRGEVHGGKRTTLYIAAMLYTIVILAILAVSYSGGTLLQTIPFLLFFMVMIFIPLRKAIKSPVGPNIGKAVKSGVISLIIMNASWAAAVDNIVLALIILALLPVSLLLAKVFAVT